MDKDYEREQLWDAVLKALGADMRRINTLRLIACELDATSQDVLSDISVIEGLTPLEAAVLSSEASHNYFASDQWKEFYAEALRTKRNRGGHDGE
jgi:hypothetical protein